MPRKLLTNAQWRHASQFLPPERGGNRRPYSSSHRHTSEAILWIARTGAPWRDLPLPFGPWDTNYQRVRSWEKPGYMRAMFESLAEKFDLKVVAVDGSYIKCCSSPHSSGIATKKPQVEWA